MATGTTRVTLNHPTFDISIDTSSKHRTVDILQHALAGFTSGTLPITVGVTQDASLWIAFSGPANPFGDTVTINGVVLMAGQLNARGTVALASPVAEEFLTINGVKFIAKDAPSSSPGEFSLGADDIEATKNLAAKVNAHPNLLGVVEATANQPVPIMLLRAVEAGVAGNAITLAQAGGGIAISGSTFMGGADPTPGTWDYGDTAAQSMASLAAAIPLSEIGVVAANIGAALAPDRVYLTAELIPGRLVSLEATGAALTIPEDATVEPTALGGMLRF